MDRPPRIQFLCPKCEGTSWTALDKKIRCMSEENGLGSSCDATWKLSEAWQVFVLVRRFVSKMDYDHYNEKSKEKPAGG